MASSTMGELGAGTYRDQCMDASEATRADQRATVTVDRQGIIHQWGDGVTEVVGHCADDTLGRNLNILIPPALRALHWWGFDRAMKRGRMSRGKFTVPALRNDGRIVVAHARMELIPGKAGGIEAARVTFVGVAPSWQGTAWRAALAPIDLTRPIWKRARADR
jgi:PAS domain S-box-containing protein